MKTTLMACLPIFLFNWCFAGNPAYSDANWVGFDGLPGADGTVTATAVDA